MQYSLVHLQGYGSPYVLLTLRFIFISGGDANFGVHIL